MFNRVEPAFLPAGERESLQAWLEFHRATLMMKCAGLTPEQLATESCPPSTLTLIWLVRHMTGVEGWFHSFDGQPDIDDPDDAEPSAEQVERDMAAYLASVERARGAVADVDLDTVIDLPHWVADDQPKIWEPTSLRWVYQHMIEEYARHNGQADLIRERIDGAVGD
ncbi:MAG TPA: DinB family protein [Micromonosporaceae bacterium]